MRVWIFAFLIIGLYIGAEAQRGEGRGGNGGRGGGRGRGRGGKQWRGPRKGLDELCDTELNLDCGDGEWPKVFKGSSCEDISNGDFFPTYKELENPCNDSNVNTNITVTSCYVCGAIDKNNDRSKKWRRIVSGVENGINLDFTFPCIARPDLKPETLSCQGPEAP